MAPSAKTAPTDTTSVTTPGEKSTALRDKLTGAAQRKLRRAEGNSALDDKIEMICPPGDN